MRLRDGSSCEMERTFEVKYAGTGVDQTRGRHFMPRLLLAEIDGMSVKTAARWRKLFAECQFTFLEPQELKVRLERPKVAAEGAVCTLVEDSTGVTEKAEMK